MPTNIEDLFRLHQRINTPPGAGSKALQGSPAPLQEARTAEPSVKVALREAVEAFLKQFASESKSVDALLKLLAQVRDLKIAPAPQSVKNDLLGAGISEMSEKTAEKIASDLSLYMRDTKKPAAVELASLRSMRQSFLETSLRGIKEALLSVMQNIQTPGQEPLAEPKSAPLKMLENILKNLSPAHGEITETSLREALTKHIESITSTRDDIRLNLLKASSHPLEPLTIMLEAALQQLANEPQSEPLAKSIKILSELLKDLKEFMKENAPDGLIRERLKEARLALGEPLQMPELPPGVKRLLPQIASQIDILLSSKELSLSYGIDFASTSEEFKQAALALKESLLTFAFTLPKDNSLLKTAEKSISLLTKLIENGLTQNEVVTLKQTLPALQRAHAMPMQNQDRVRSALFELTLIENLATQKPYDPIGQNILKALTKAVSEQVESALYEKLLKTPPHEISSVIPALREQLASRLSTDNIASQTLPERNQQLQQQIIRSLIQEFTSLATLTPPEEGSRDSLLFNSLQSVYRNISETRDVLLRIAGGSQETTLQKILQIMNQAQEGSISLREMRAGLETILQENESPLKGPQLKSYDTGRATTRSPSQVPNSTMHPLISDLPKQDIAVLRSAEQILQAGAFLKQINPLMESLGQPTFILFPGLIRGILSHTEISFFKAHPQHEEANQGDSVTDKAPFSCISMKMQLPKLGTTLVYGALRKQEIYLTIGCASPQAQAIIIKCLFRLSNALRNKGYTVKECRVEVSTHESGTPGWLKGLSRSANSKI